MTNATARPLRALLAEERVLAVVRAATVPDAAALCSALAEGGIRVVELTFTIAGVEKHLAVAAEYAATAAGAGIVVGAGTVLEAEQARAAIDAGASFLVTPALGRSTEAVLAVGRDAGVPVLPGALTPSEVLAAMDLGADVVKIFPASVGGARYLSDLRGPFPDVALVPSGGITADSARSFLDAGALAVSAGTSVVPPQAVADAEWGRITEAARAFRTALGRAIPAAEATQRPDSQRPDKRGDR